LIYTQTYEDTSFIEAEDGIQYGHVTRVHTCPLPISSLSSSAAETSPTDSQSFSSTATSNRWKRLPRRWSSARTQSSNGCRVDGEIGRASCRERAEISVVGVMVRTQRRWTDW